MKYNYVGGLDVRGLKKGLTRQIRKRGQKRQEGRKGGGTEGMIGIAVKTLK